MGATASMVAFSVGYGICNMHSTSALAELLRVQLGGGFQRLPLPPGTREDMLWDVAFITGNAVRYGSAGKIRDRNALRGQRGEKATR